MAPARANWQAVEDKRAIPHEKGTNVNDLPFGTLLYRYFFFEWLFLDANKGNLFERAAALRHNQSQAHWLPVYMRRWLWFGALLYALGGIVEMHFGAPVVSAFFYVPSVLSVPVNAVMAVAWVGLKTM
jgi:hypothetical protein